MTRIDSEGRASRPAQREDLCEALGSMESRGGRVKDLGLETIEKFTIDITQTGMDIIGREGISLTFSPLEALMLLDILRHEEQNLRKMADEASPLPMKMSFKL
jgi:hypothetical protein